MGERMLILTVCLSVIVVLISSCAGTLTSVDTNTAGNAIVDARESIALARASNAEEHAQKELALAENLIESAQESLRKGESREAASLAFQADMQAKIAMALARETKAKRRAAEAREGMMEIMWEMKNDQVAIAEVRKNIAEDKAMKAQKEAEKIRAQTNLEIQKAKAELAIAKLDLQILKYREMLGIDDNTPEDELPIHGKDSYLKAESLIQKAKSAIESHDFQKAESTIDEASQYISNAIMQANVRLEAEMEESLRFRDRAIAAKAIAELNLERAKDDLATQYAKDMYEKAESILKDVEEALKKDDYIRAESLAEQARVAASNALAVSESKKRETMAQEALEDIRANALDAIAKAKRNLKSAESAGAIELANDMYKKAQVAIDRAEQALSEEKYDQVKSLAEESISHSSIALSLAEAKKELNEKIQQVESNITEEAGQIPETTVRKVNRGIVISMGGNLFDQGSSRISSEAQPRLKQLAEILKKHNEYNIIIEGHTDSIGPEGTNLKISNDRAANFLKYLVDKEDIPRERLSSVGYGESRPITSNLNEAGRRQNRRVDIVILTNPVSP
jgi:outer membrane protein OmpA-like peptidoglycan-associated protein